MRATQRIFLATKEATRPVKETRLSDGFIGNQEKQAERNALLWLHRAEVDVDKQAVLRLHEVPLRRYWTKCRYSKEWIDKQFAV
jgi:hypothetical protein